MNIFLLLPIGFLALEVLAFKHHDEFGVSYWGVMGLVAVVAVLLGATL